MGRGNAGKPVEYLFGVPTSEAGDDPGRAALADAKVVPEMVGAAGWRLRRNASSTVSPTAGCTATHRFCWVTDLIGARLTPARCSS